ncbi:DsbA family protein [Saccharomonospora halophila]|uniref:DsbA family protein n=1 Tax=Saccharomonospora halophila TaxID=129922 RepID=UPI00035CB15A|nr:DsbA family protein [Saccharomonospora halophila]
MPNTSRRTSKRDLTLVAVLVVAAIGLITYLVVSPPGGEESAAPRPAGPSAPSASQNQGSAGADENPLSGLARRDEGDPTALGPVNAPVTMVMYSDYRCPFCAKFSRDIEPELIDRYVDSGQLRIEWRDFPIFGEQSESAARAGRAAAEQGRFWEYHRAIFEDSPERGHPDLTRAELLGYAREVGMPDMETFTADLDDPSLDEPVDKDLREGSSIGVSSTPAFVINGEPILGAQPLDTFVEVIEKAAKQA